MQRTLNFRKRRRGQNDSSDGLPKKICKVGLVETKRSLHKHQPDSLPCREKEMKKLSTFICSHLRNDTPGSLYVSGPPGTGKTACLTRVMEKVAGDHLTLSINCISAVRPRMIFQRIAEQLGLKPSKSVVSFQDQLAKYFTTSKKMILLVLDEVDMLNQDVLYSLFELPELANSKLILIGVANTLNCFDQRLSTFKPSQINFSPYSTQDIITILGDRLGKDEGIFEPSAIQFCARKVSSVSGDLRKALDLCRSAIDLAGGDRVCIKHVVQVLSEVVPSHTPQDAAPWPLLPQVALCSLLDSRSQAVSLGKVYESYKAICTRRKLTCESESDFKGAIDFLEVRGVVKIQKKKEIRSSVICLTTEKTKLLHYFKDKTLFSAIVP